MTQRTVGLIGLAALTAGLCLPAATASAVTTGDSVDQVYAGTQYTAGRCAYAVDGGWGRGVGVEFTPAVDGGVSRLLVEVSDPTSSQPGTPPDAVFALRFDEYGVPGTAPMAQVSVSPATIAAAPLAPGSTRMHQVELDFPGHPGVAAGARYWLTLTVPVNATATQYCMDQVYSAQPQADFEVFTWGDNFEGGNAETTAGQGYPLTEYVGSTATVIDAVPYYDALAQEPLQTNGYQAVLVAPDGVAYAGQRLSFYSGGRLICAATTDVGGLARCPAGSPPPAADGYEVIYAGDGAYLRPSGGHGDFLRVRSTVGSGTVAATVG